MPSVGFSIQSTTAEEHPEEMMAQSQMIDVMFETSEHTRSSRPGKPQQPLQILPPLLMTQSVGFVTPPLTQPMMQISLSFDQTPRRQLEDMARRGQRFCSLPPVPELSTPSESSMVESARTESSPNPTGTLATEPAETSSSPPPAAVPMEPMNNPMTTSRLFQEFSNRHLREQGY
ncbi:unnamed protein product [Gongylonema pulchrum]|uniref:TMV resistance protein N-like n=1 Tax=Gongylonema pulchrum TaxID=637853 RepID=A0A183CY54_9BILA|nr:unnamed protein product [Gongylonema pulchrum]